VLKIDEAGATSSSAAGPDRGRADEKKTQLLAELEVGMRRKACQEHCRLRRVRRPGGIDGLLHITDMSWGRINHPSEMVAIDQEIEVQILHIDYEKEKIAWGSSRSRQPLENVPSSTRGKQIRAPWST